MKSVLGDVRHHLKLAVPITVGFLVNMLMQVVDAFFLGKLGPYALGAASLANGLFNTIMVLGIGLTSSLDYYVSHAFGAGKIRECHRFWFQSNYISTTYALFGIAVMHFGAEPLFHVLGVDPKIVEPAKQYLAPLEWSLIPFLWFVGMRQYLQAMGVVNPIMLILVIANVINAILNQAFVFGTPLSPAMGVFGSGLATLIARVLTVSVGMLYLRRLNKRRHLELQNVSIGMSWNRIQRLLKMGAPAGLQMLLEVGVFAGSSFVIGRLGPVYSAAHYLVLQMASIVFMLPLGLSIAASVRVGQALGARQVAYAVRLGWTALGFGAAAMTITGFFLYLLSTWWMKIFSVDPNVISIGVGLMLVAAYFQISDATQAVATGILRGSGDTKSSMVANGVGHWLIGFPLGCFLCFWRNWGPLGIWVGLSLGLTVVAGILILAWKRRSAELLKGIQKI